MNLRYAEEKNERGIALHPFVHQKKKGETLLFFISAPRDDHL